MFSALRFIKPACIFLLAMVFTVQAFSSEPAPPRKILPPPTHQWRAEELLQMSQLYELQSGENPRIFQNLDVKNYTMNLDFDVSGSKLDAQVTITGAALDEKLDQIIVDFYDDVPISAVKFNGGNFTQFERKNNKVYCDLSASPVNPNAEFSITFSYTFPLSSQFTHGIVLRDQNGTPAVCSSGQPYGNSGWWPCFDYPSDKATVDVHITCPENLIAVSNGALQGAPIKNGDGTQTVYWKESHPLYTSAFAVAISGYETWQDSYVSPLDGTVMPLYFYAFPEDAQKARNDYTLYTKEALPVFATRFGEYPFIDEKYGVLESPFSRGSLEHQTITHLTYKATQAESNWDVVVHELGHQWWGDWVTCKTWNHVWLQEGLATYAEVLFNESYTGEAPGVFMAKNYDDGLYDGILAGTPYSEDISQPWDEYNAVYEKGGWVLHMLRNMLGDEPFFKALQDYGKSHAYGAVETDDLRAAMESAYGVSLAPFFDQWVYTPFRPVYQYEFSASPVWGGKYQVDLLLYQAQAHKIKNLAGEEVRDYYLMPLDVTLQFKDGSSQTFTVYNSSRRQRFQFMVDKEPASVAIDQDIKILKVAETPIADKGTNILPTARAGAFPRTVSAKGSVFLFGRGMDADGSIARYTWVIDNKKMVEGRFALATFEESGTHQVALMVEDDQGGAGTSAPVTVTVR
ncbi:MAG: M1 family aminopeptidase [Proteobacteria bacterium]|nr:M1 family aminopeptidase [Pseudomonadota bacterium]